MSRSKQALPVQEWIKAGRCLRMLRHGAISGYVAVNRVDLCGQSTHIAQRLDKVGDWVDQAKCQLEAKAVAVLPAGSYEVTHALYGPQPEDPLVWKFVCGDMTQAERMVLAAAVLQMEPDALGEALGLDPEL